MNIKQYLQQAFLLDKQIQANKFELERLRALAESVPAMMLTGDRVQTSSPTDRISRTVANIVDLESQIQNEINKYITIKYEIRNTINRVADSKLKLILQKRYLNFQSWEEIAVEMGYTTRRVWQLHGEALDAVPQNISLNFT
jgi:DNA-directed RNA polymerase specialized sigma subunit